MKILQLAHGRILPAYTSAYSLRCHNYLKLTGDRMLMSVSGLVLRDEKGMDSVQYRSLLTLLFAILRKGRSLEIYISKGFLLRRKYLKDAREAIKNSDVIIFEGPWQFSLFSGMLEGKKVVYDAHNVETNLRKSNRWEDYARSLEMDLCSRADLIITVTEEDREMLMEMASISESRIQCIPEGYSNTGAVWSGLDSNTILFIGSAYIPNIEAVQRISDMALELPNFNFKIIGSVGSAVSKRKMAKNVEFLGELSERDKDNIMSGAILALNPVMMGSGRNLKVNDYVSHGVPVITTPIGARGFDPELVSNLFVADIREFPNKIKEVSSNKKLLSRTSEFYLNYSIKNNYTATQEKARQAIENLFAQ